MLWNEAIRLASRQERNHGRIASQHHALRQRMVDDMGMRKLAEKTQSHYIRAVRQFAGFLGHSPDTATVEDLRRYQLLWVANSQSSGNRGLEQSAAMLPPSVMIK